MGIGIGMGIYRASFFSRVHKPLNEKHTCDVFVRDNMIPHLKTNT